MKKVMYVKWLDPNCIEYFVAYDILRIAYLYPHLTN